MESELIILKNRMHMLKKYASYNEEEDNRTCAFKFTYEFSKILRNLKEKYCLLEIMKEKKDQAILILLLRWVYDHTKHNGKRAGIFHEMNTDYLLNECQHGRGVTCLMIAIILQELCMSFGFYARIVQTKSFDPLYLNSHWVTSVFLIPLNKWVMLDATYGVYCTQNETFLSIEEMRNLIIHNQSYKVNSVSNKPAIIQSEYKALQIETYFQFDTLVKHGYNSFYSGSQNRLNLYPIGFNTKKYREDRLQVELSLYEEEDKVILCAQNAIMLFSDQVKNYWQHPCPI